MAPAISYIVSAPNPHNHRFAVTMTVDDVGGASTVELALPVWTPGSYLVREYAQYVMGLSAADATGQRRAVEKRDKATWVVDVQDCKTLQVTYEVYGFELSPRHNHLDGSHGFFNPVASCLYLKDRMDEPLGLTVIPREDWQVFCGLAAQPHDGDGVHFVARDVDELFDSPVEMGDHQYFDFEVQGVPHRFVACTEADVDLEPLAAILPDIVAQNASIFGEIPYERYVFINHVVPGAWGGLEHRHSSVNLFSPKHLWDNERGDDGEFDKDFANVLRLLSHEHFHAYNVKRLRPEALGPFDYQSENYTRALWAVEGLTSYFDTYHLRQAEIIGPGRYVSLLEKRIAQLEKVPGRFVQSLEESSFDAWIGLYRRTENTRNATVSYYLKGELVAWLMDLWVRHHSDGAKTLGDAMRQLWSDYYVAQGIGFPPGAAEAAIGEAAGADPTALFDDLVRGREAIAWEEYLAPVGLRLAATDGDGGGWLGIDTKGDGPAAQKVSFVAHDSPADQGGLYVGDRLVALDRWSLDETKLEDVLAAKEPGATVELHVLRRGRLEAVRLTVGQAPEEFELQRIDDASTRQLELLEQWLGASEWNEDP